jgi:hypothetical protein
MADIHPTLSGISINQKMRLYDSIAQINRDSRSIILTLQDLKRIEIFRSEPLRTLQGLIRELQAEINCHLLEVVRDAEMKEAFVHGKARIARDRRENSTNR